MHPEDNGRDMRGKKMGKMTNRQFRNESLGKKRLTKREKLLLLICCSHLQSFFAECTSSVAPQGIHNHPLTQRKSFIPLSTTNRLCNKTSVFHRLLHSVSILIHPPHPAFRLIILLTLSQAVQVHQFVQSLQWTGKGDSDLLAKFMF